MACPSLANPSKNKKPKTLLIPPIESDSTHLLNTRNIGKKLNIKQREMLWAQYLLSRLVATPEIFIDNNI